LQTIHVTEKNGQFDQVGRRTAYGLKGYSEVLKDLFNLRSKIVLAHQLALLVECCLPRNEYQAASLNLHHLGIPRWRSQFGRIYLANRRGFTARHPNFLSWFATNCSTQLLPSHFPLFAQPHPNLE
jgi:hypothetical protein